MVIFAGAKKQIRKIVSRLKPTIGSILHLWEYVTYIEILDNMAFI